jgi:hypothetical protein
MRKDFPEKVQVSKYQFAEEIIESAADFASQTCPDPPDAREVFFPVVREWI